jgi:hypothetical protein
MQLHVVAFRFKSEVTPPEQAAFLDGLRDLLASYPYIKVLALGENTSSRDSTLPYGFVAQFPSHDAVEEYVFDPRHRQWATDSWYPVVEEFKVVSLAT